MAPATLQSSKTAAAVVTPAAPAHLPAAVQQQWTAAYTKALAQATLDYPDNDRAQRGAALKAANAMLAVPAPQSAAEIDALESWQVLHRFTRTSESGAATRHCVTADGRKYSHPIPEPEPDDTGKGKGKGGK